jgi:hypothetical protein
VGAQNGTGANAVPGAPAAVSAWVSDGGDVVSVNADPPTAEAIRLLVGDARGIEPMEMPAVEAPPGEWRRPEDIEPDGPRGSVDPESPERSA